jgi:hypothetical protein
MIEDILLRDATVDDIPALFAFQRDREACRMAAFTSTDDPDDEDAFARHWSKVLGTESRAPALSACSAVTCGK